MAVAFSSSGEEIVQKQLSSETFTANTSPELPGDVQDFFETERCCQWITENQYKRVALQFGDSHLRSSVQVARKLSERTSADVFVLADTSYGSCCVDEVAALHYQADSIIHFGYSCLSQSDRLPVLHIFGRGVLDLEVCCKKFVEQVPDPDGKIALISTVEYDHALEKLRELLLKHYKCVLLADLNFQLGHGEKAIVGSAEATDNDKKDGTHEAVRESSEAQGKSAKGTGWSTSLHEKGIFEIFGRHFALPVNENIKDYNVFYMGEESMLLTNLMMSCRETAFVSFRPSSGVCQKESASVNRLLMKRFYFVEKVKDANVIGILVATLSVAKYMDIVKRLKFLISHAGKKYYVFSVGKINVAKLANFPDVDVYVLVSCPESIILDSSEYYSSIVTPFEVEVACNPERDWTGDVVLDYSQLLPGGAAFQDVDFDKAVTSTDVSLITGGMRRMGVETSEDVSTAGTSAVAVRDPMVLSAVSGDLFSRHTWHGLEQKLGETKVTKAIQGRKGIAIQYEEEPS